MSCTSVYCENCSKIVLPRDVDTMLSYFQRRYSTEYSWYIIRYVMNNHSCNDKKGLDAFFDY